MVPPMLAEFVTPNLHVALIHYPLGLLVAGVMIETFAFLGWRRSGFRVAGRWMIGVGAAGGVVAAFSGIYALQAVAATTVDTGWADLRAASPTLHDPATWSLLWHHTLYQSCAAGLAMAAVVVWIGCSDRGRRAAHWPVLIALLGSVGGMVVGAWFGGEAIYRHGVGVEGVPSVERSATTAPAVAAEAAKADKGDDRLTERAAEKNEARPTVPPAVARAEQLFPPTELHVVFAGTATAVALLSLGLSARRITAAHELADDRRPIRPGPRLPGADLGYELSMDPNVRQPPSAVAMARSFNPDVEVRVRPRVPAARFWLLSFAAAAVTSLLGWYVLARAADIDFVHQPKQVAGQLWNQIRPQPNEPRLNRLLTHALSGSAIVALPVVLALLARFAPRQRVLLGLCGLVLVAAVAAQVWVGVLLLYDGSDGPVTRFKPATAAAVAER